MPMADVQKENGYTAIANDLLEALYRFGLTRNEYKVMFCVIRHTYGYNKKEHSMSLTFIANDTGISKTQVYEAISRLNVKNLLFVSPAKGVHPQVLSVQKDPDKWVSVPDSGTVPESGTVPKKRNTTVPETGTLSVPETGTKERQYINTDKRQRDSGADNPHTPPTPKPVRHKHGEYKHVLLTDEQYNKLLSDYGSEKLDAYIRKVDEYCEQTGKKYKNYLLTIRNWIRKDEPEHMDVSGSPDEILMKHIGSTDF